jgi:acetyltransferase-like isoleucine patch superfamily enzyme
MVQKGANAPKHEVTFADRLYRLLTQNKFFMKVLNYLLGSFPIEDFRFYSGGGYQRARRCGFGDGTVVCATAIIYGHPKIGKNVFIGPYTIIDGTGPLAIGDGCQISPHAMIWTHGTHHWCLLGDDKNIKVEAVTIERNVWIGAGAIIVPGVHIGHHSMIAAGSVVTTDVSPYSLVAGVPARVIRKIRINKNKIEYEPP